jgi:hypothetical protein
MAEARQLLTDLYATSEQRYVPPTYLAVAEIGLGEIDRAFKALDAAYAAKDGTLLFLRILPIFKVLRRDARYEALCRRIGLADSSAMTLSPVTAPREASMT